MIGWLRHPGGSTKPPLAFSPPAILAVGRLPHHPSPTISSSPAKKLKMSPSLINNSNSFNTAISVLTNYTIADDRSQILTWLSPLEPRLQHQDIQNRRVENVGEWLLQTEEFRNWYASNEESEDDNAVLFCYGNPGVGKTYIR